MVFVTLPCSSPQQQLAGDEALLDYCEANRGHEGFMRFWETEVPFVALGYSKCWRKEVFEEVCAAEEIPVLRRCSGGGTVLQARGCLNYALVLPIDSRAELESISSTNEFIMGEQASALRDAFGLDLRVQGCSDLTLGGRKFCGNSQRRKRRYLLFHGSFLLSADLQLIGRSLRLPEQQPDYRGHRTHGDFLVNLGLPSTKVEEALIEHWRPDRREPDDADRAAIMQIVDSLEAEKYGREEWNLKF